MAPRYSSNAPSFQAERSKSNLLSEQSKQNIIQFDSSPQQDQNDNSASGYLDIKNSPIHSQFLSG